MTRLLVSVRHLEEAWCAVEGGADMIDLKEPCRGPLGACLPCVWQEVSQVLGGRVPLSAALGELADWRGDVTPASLVGVRFVKLGLSGCRRLSDWRQRWRGALDDLPRGTAAVAVAYADHQTADAPAPGDVLETGIHLGCGALLVDTYDKRRGDVFSHCPAEQLQTLFARARRAGLWTVLAGSLTHESLEPALRLAPDVVAVRGAACRGDRAAEIDAGRVRALAEAMNRVSPRRQGFVS
jgi:uncharacterized protein (UPF0264 family)